MLAYLPIRRTPRLHVAVTDIEEAIAALDQSSVAAVCNLSGYHYAVAADVKLLEVSQEDGEGILPETLDRFLAWADEQSGDVIVHCYAGISRSSAFLIAYMLHLQLKRDAAQDLDMLWSVALRWVQEVRPIANPHWKLKESILQYFEDKHGIKRHIPFNTN